MEEDCAYEEKSLFDILVNAYNGDLKKALSSVCEEIEEVFGEEDFSAFIRSVVTRDFIERKQYYVN